MPEISVAASSRVFYRKIGSGPAMVLLHGFPESSDIWRNIWQPLSALFTLIMPDFPGAGNSLLEASTGIDEMADCVKSVLDAEGIRKAVIAGHSMGGYVAFAFAARYPDYVEGLSVVHSSPFADDEERKKIRLRSIEIIKNGGKETFIHQMVGGLFSEEFKQNQPDIVREHEEASLTVSESALINFYYAMIGRQDHSRMLQSVPFPVQWIAGLNDQVIPFKKTLSLSHEADVNFLSLYPACGHMSMLELPDRLTEDLIDFMNYMNFGQKVIK